MRVLVKSFSSPFKAIEIEHCLLASVLVDRTVDIVIPIFEALVVGIRIQEIGSLMKPSKLTLQTVALFGV